jgi:rhodanese-related sulfurtransferase
MTVQEMLARAVARGASASHPYAGAVTPTEAHALVEAGVALMIDVRYAFEREYVGRVDLASADLHVPWRLHNGTSSALNPDFIAQLKQAVTQFDKPLLMLCRSGIRSRHAAKAATEAGYTQAFDILEGFEGDLDTERHRGNVGGWRNAGLPWIQD